LLVRRILLLAVVGLTAAWGVARAQAADDSVDLDLRLPSVPEIPHLIGLPRTFRDGRAAYLALVRQEAERGGLPPDVADAVATVESGYRTGAVGRSGEIGLMQVRPETAALLGHRGGLTNLFDPETNVRFGVMYLAQAWRLADGDLCRALMKYRAGHGEERMSPLSVIYCRRAREHLASIGSPLAGGNMPFASVHTAAAAKERREPERTEAFKPLVAGKHGHSGASFGINTRRRPPDRLASELLLAQAQARRRTTSLSAYWEAYEAQVRALKGRLGSDKAPRATRRTTVRG